MDTEMHFPNPVMRNDLPVKRNPWPRAIAALVVIGALGIALLPQILHTRIGNKFARLYIESKFPDYEVSLGEFRTSWFGPTTLTRFFIASGDGRVIGCKSFTSDISLLRLLRGHYRLGRTTIDGLYLDYTLDYGDGTDSLSRLFPGLLPNPNGAAFTAITEPRLSADALTVTDGTINLYRCHVDPDSLATVYQSCRIANIEGTINFPSLDAPCSCDLAGTVGAGEAQTGTVHSTGSFTVGQAGQITPKTIKIDLIVAGENWPTATVAPVLFRRWQPSDFQEAIGVTADSVKIPIVADNGEVRIAPLSVKSALADISVPLVYDMNSVPRRWKLGEGPNTLGMGLARSLARTALVQAVPLLSEATGEGHLQLHLDSFSIPLEKAFSREESVRGQMQLNNAKLDPSRPALSGGAATNLTRQIMSLIGTTPNAQAKPVLHAPDVKFDLHDGQLNVEPSPITVGSTGMSLSGSNIIGGPLQMVLTFSDLPTLRAAVPGITIKMLTIPLTGTIREPRLDLDAIKEAMPAAMAKKMEDFISDQIAAMRIKEVERVNRQQDAEVDKLLSPFEGRPATQP